MGRYRLLSHWLQIGNGLELRALFLSLVLLSPVSAWSQTVNGKVRVIDGDTFQFETGLKVRIFGIDTLEKNQKCESKSKCIPCGQESKNVAITLIGKSQISCELKGQKSYDREVAMCTVDGKDYGESIIASGWAMAYRSFLPQKGKGHPYGRSRRTSQSRAFGDLGHAVHPAL